MRYLFITFVLLSQLCTAQETWIPLDGPQDGDIDFIERDSSGILYAGKRGDFSLYRSTDNAESWKRITPGGATHSLAIDRNGNLYLTLANAGGATSPIQGLVYSSDRGDTWSTLEAKMPNARIVAVAPDGLIFFATHNVLRRRSSGETVWKTINIVRLAPTNPANQIQRLAWFADGDLFAGTLAGVYRTTNHGDTWTRASTGLADSAIRELTNVGGDLYAGSDSALWRSSDKGESWTRVDIAGQTPVILAASSPDRVMVGTRDGSLYRSSDRGSTWERSSPPYLFFRAISRGAGESIVAGSVLHGTWLTSDGGDSWRRSVRGMNSGNVVTLSIAPDGTMAAGLRGRYSGRFYSSTDAGSTWIMGEPDSTPAAVWCSAALPGGDLLMGTEGTGIYRSSDNGLSWRRQNTGLTNLTIRSIAVKPNGEVLAGTEGKGMFISRNNGQTWAPTSLDSRQVWAIAIHPDGTILAGLEKGTIRYSTDDGATWNGVVSSGLVSDIQAFTIAPDGSIYAASFESGVFRSSDTGRVWSPTTYTRRILFAAAALPSGEVVIGGYGGVVRTTDNGATWDTIGGAFSPRPDWLALDSSGALLAAGGTIYRMLPGTPGGVDRDDNAGRARISISPNPVASGATLHISVPHAGHTWVRIYDITGRLHRTLHAGQGGAILWPVELPPGIYYCVVESDGVIGSSTRIEVR